MSPSLIRLFGLLRRTDRNNDSPRRLPEERQDAMKTLRNRQNLRLTYNRNPVSVFSGNFRENAQFFPAKTENLRYDGSVRIRHLIRHREKGSIRAACSLTISFSPLSWGANTMSRTSTIHRGTSRSLQNNSTRKGETEKVFRSFFLGLLILVAFVLGANTYAAGDTRAVEKGTAEILRQDIVHFQGEITEKDTQNATNSTDGYMVSVNRRIKGQTPASYGFLLKGIDSVERTLLQDAKDGKWDNVSLFRATLVAEGVRDARKIREYEAKLDNVLVAVNAKLGSNPSPEALTREVFEAIHRQLLTNTYDINCTELTRTLETGHFNCVSATILFNCVAEKAGLDVSALEMPGHALSRVKIGNVSMDLETTCPNWFTLQDDKARRAATARRIAPSVATANPGLAGTQDTTNESYKKLREITPVQLVATIYYNQGVDFLAEEKFAEAIVANLKALQLDPASETAWGNLLASINNWSIKLVGENKRYDLAARLLDQGVYLDPTYDKFRENQLHIYHHWISALDREGRTADAKKVFEIADQRLPNDADLRSLMQSIGK